MTHIRRLADYIWLIKHSIVRFGAVGAVGFAVNLTVLTLLYRHMSVELLFAQIIAAEVAILSNFVLHNNWTYKDAVKDSLLKRLLEFHATSWVGSGITTLTLLFLVDRSFQYIVALAIGAVIALVWNFFWTRFFIWKPKDSAYDHSG